MKLTTKNLKQLINEVMSEVRLEPDYDDFASDDQITKIRSLLDSDDPESINMAKTLLDALGANPSYFDDYMQNQEVGDVEKLSNKHGADGANFYGLDALGEYFTELDKFEDREVKRGRLLPDPSVEFHDRYQSVADTYEPRDINEENLDEGFFSKIFGGEDDEPERSPERQKELEDRLAKMKRGEKIVKPKTADQKASDMLAGTDKMQDELSGFDSMSDDEKFGYIMKNKILTPKMKAFYNSLPRDKKEKYLRQNGNPKKYMRESMAYKGDDSILEQYNVDQVAPDKGSKRLVSDALGELEKYEKKSGFLKRPTEEMLSLVARGIIEASESDSSAGMELLKKSKDLGIAKAVYKIINRIKSGNLTFPQYESKQRLGEGLMYEGDDSILEQFRGATLEEGDLVCEACLFEQLQEASCGCPDLMGEAEYQGKKVTLNKPTRGDVKKFKVYVKDPSTGNVKKVNFGHGGSSAKAKGEKTMKIRKNNPKARKSFRARHNCKNPGPKTKARYWSCKKW